MPPNEPAPTAPFTDEDRAEVARVQCALDTYGEQNMASYQLLILRLASHIDHLEKQQLERAETISRFSKARLAEADRADHLERALREIADHPDDLSCDGNCEEHMVEIARAALKGEDDGRS